MSDILAEARDVSKRFTTDLDVADRIAARFGAKRAPTTVHALDGVDLQIARGEVVGLVGESGCGKSTLGRIMAGTLSATDGEVLIEGRERGALRGRAARQARLSSLTPPTGCAAA